MRGPFLIWVLSAIRLVPSGSSSCLGCRHSTHHPPGMNDTAITQSENFFGRTDSNSSTFQGYFFFSFLHFQKVFQVVPDGEVLVTDRLSVRRSVAYHSILWDIFQFSFWLKNVFFLFGIGSASPALFTLDPPRSCCVKIYTTREKKKLNLLSKLSDSFTGAWARRVSFFFLVPSCCCCCCLVGLMERNGQNWDDTHGKKKERKAVGHYPGRPKTDERELKNRKKRKYSQFSIQKPRGCEKL